MLLGIFFYYFVLLLLLLARVAVLVCVCDDTGRDAGDALLNLSEWTHPGVVQQSGVGGFAALVVHFPPPSLPPHNVFSC